ncbi:circadian clock protein KaiB [Hymenobacter gummosus]|uniref:Circadian clock protein KaiB n=1 Tax=Hymenobacter gummosus TaxID=1776032 RepID=A0A3S0HK12_9BACT|nr:circadian clock KaiB family protein [Hymenobacter gummosus]RTQ46070.1 circadian clock protein KaiB [Hymenobacter gummosus]
MEAPEQPEAAGAEYELHLYIAGNTPSAAAAVRNLQDICERYLAGRVELRIIDLSAQPEAAGEEQIVASPTLVKKRPGLTRFLVGDLSDRRRVLALLGLTPDAHDPYLHD